MGITTLNVSSTLQPQTYIASTSVGRLFRLSLTSSGGKYHLSNHAFSRPSSSLSLTRLLPGFWSVQELQPQRGNINAVAICNLSRDATGRVVWALVDTRLQQWNMAIEGWEEFLLEEDIGEQTRLAVREHFPHAPQEDVELDLELLDLRMQGSNDMVLLVSFAGQDDEFSMDVVSHPRRIYAILSMRHLPGVFQILKVQAVPYQSVSSSPNMMTMTAEYFADIELWRTHAPQAADRSTRETRGCSVRRCCNHMRARSV